MSKLLFQGGNAMLQVFFQGANVTLQVLFQGGMLCHKYFFRVEMRRLNALGRQRLKPKAAALHGHPGLKTVLKALQVYRQACSKGTVQTNPANCYNAKILACLKC